jgi:type IV pilus assembly protein PilE
MLSRMRGVTLIELIVVVAIIAIIAAFAYPSYLDHVHKAKRADAETALMELAQYMERYYTTNGQYKTAGEDDATVTARLPYNQVPRDGIPTYTYYDLSAVGVTNTSFTLQAAPKNAMAGDDCGNLSLSSTGVKSRSGTASIDLCWRQ